MSNNDKRFTFVELLVALIVIFFVILVAAIPVSYLLYHQDYPSLPQTYYADIQEVVIKPVNVNAVKLDQNFNPMKEPLFRKGTDKIAVFEFQTPEGTQGGALVSDMFTALLEKERFKVLERDNIEKILQEKELLGDTQKALTDLDVANRLGQLIAADYMIFGAVTLYQAEPQTVYIPIRIKDEQREKYINDYNAFKNWYLSKFWPFWKSQEKRKNEIRDKIKIFEISELEEKLKELDRREFHVIASVGISAKVVDVKSGAIRWLGQGETNDFTLVAGTKRILDEFLKSMQNEEATKSIS